MNIRLDTRSTRPGLLGFTLLATLLVCNTTLAHEVPHDDHEAAALADHPAADSSDTDIRELLLAFRRSGDDHHLEHAWALLEPALSNDGNNPDPLVEAAMVAQSRHQFELALTLVERALSMVDNHDQAWMLGAAIHLVRGNADQAEHFCRQLRYVPLLVNVTCRARASVARGNHEEALGILTALLDSPAADALNPDWLAWSLSVAGDAAAPLDAQQAESLYTQSLEAAESTQVRAALVDTLLADDRPGDAARVLDAGADALPLEIRRMIVDKRLGRDSAATRIADVDHEFRHWIGEGDWLHAREMARFYLDVLEQPDLARRLAEINLTLQREPEDLLLASRTGAN